ncbi:uncharacterized [Tachysurus ichikawai]
MNDFVLRSSKTTPLSSMFLAAWHGSPSLDSSCDIADDQHDRLRFLFLLQPFEMAMQQLRDKPVCRMPLFRATFETAL